MRVGGFLKARFEHIRNAGRTRAEIAALQRQKFRKLVAHAAEHSPHYRALVSSRAIDVDNCVPADFPPLTKSELIADFDRIVTDRRISGAGVERFLAESRDPGELFLDGYVVIPSSGTSGEVGFSVYSSAEWSRVSALAVRTLPFALRRRRIAFYGLTAGHQGSATGASTTGRSAARLRFASRSFDVEAPIEKTINGLNEFQPDILSGMPSGITELAHAQEAGLLRIAPGLLSLGGDALTPGDRALLDRVFGSNISNQYGSSEHLTLGYGLSEDGGIYLFEDEMIFEIEDDRVLVTSLFKYTQPIIRYALDDQLVPMDDPNPRLPFTKVKDIGRRPVLSPTFTDRHGKDVTIELAILEEFAVPNVERIQLRAVDKQSCLLRVKLMPGLAEGERAKALDRAEQRLAEIFSDASLENVSRRIEEVGSFGGRKVRLVVLPGTIDTMSDDWQRIHSAEAVV